MPLLKEWMVRQADTNIIPNFIRSRPITLFLNFAKATVSARRALLVQLLICILYCAMLVCTCALTNEMMMMTIA